MIRDAYVDFPEDQVWYHRKRKRHFFHEKLIGNSSKCLAAIKTTSCDSWDEYGCNMDVEWLASFYYPNHMPQDFSLL